ALAVAVVAGSLGGALPAGAAPPAPATASVPDTGADTTEPSVWPRPQSLRANGAPVAVTDEVAVIAQDGTDGATLDAVRALLRRAGASRFTAPGAPVPEGALVV